MEGEAWAVAIPARNEAETVGDCLRALARQTIATEGHVVLLVNNSDDDTAAEAVSVEFPPSMTLHILETVLPPDMAHAGGARRLAMSHAVEIVGPAGIVLTTDADGMADADWIAGNLACLRAGADAVAGWVDLVPADWSRIPTHLHEADAQEARYDALCDEIKAILDPDGADPLPRHTQNSGASIAVSVDAYRRCGGVPAIVCGEDRALIAALNRVDARIRHAPGVHVQVSGRIDGRSVGGMADTIKRRLVRADPYIDDRLEPAARCASRFELRAAVRSLYGFGGSVGADLAQRLGMEPSELEPIMRLPYFGMAWDEIETKSPALNRERVAVAILPREIASATTILTKLKVGRDAGRARRSGSIHPVPQLTR